MAAQNVPVRTRLVLLRRGGLYGRPRADAHLPPYVILSEAKNPSFPLKRFFVAPPNDMSRCYTLPRFDVVTPPPHRYHPSCLLYTARRCLSSPIFTKCEKFFGGSTKGNRPHPGPNQAHPRRIQKTYALSLCRRSRRRAAAAHLARSLLLPLLPSAELSFPIFSYPILSYPIL